VPQKVIYWQNMMENLIRVVLGASDNVV